MLLPAVLFCLSLIYKVIGDCPAGYDDGGAGCYKVLTNKVTRNNAARACQLDGAYLTNIPNAIVNTMLQGDARAANLQAIWIGLTCESNTPASCQFDDSTNFLGGTSFSNFAPGFPDSNSGQCIYMASIGANTGRWFSADCSTTLGYACVYEGDIGGNGCMTGYTYYNGQCYKVISSADEPTAEAVCESNCGYITSVLTHDENVFVLGLAVNSSVRTNGEIYTRIGLKTSGFTNKYSWEDGTPLGIYSNFGDKDPNLGNCVGMALQDDVVNQGEWINTKCDYPLISVCKNSPGGQCNASTSSPTSAPGHCSGTDKRYNNGTIYSPGYPSFTVPGKCVYLLDGPVGYLVRIKFTSLLLDCGSQIELYNDLADTIPFATVTSGSNPNSYYYSAENEIKMIFISTNIGPCSTGDRWIGVFDSVYQYQSQTTASPTVASGCNQGLLTAPGYITSPNYPKNYPDNCNCEYLLGSTGNHRVSLHFNEVVTERSIDIITVYDGSDKTSNVLGRLSGTNPPLQDYISTGNRMFVTFYSDSQDNFKGFSANFTNY